MESSRGILLLALAFVTFLMYQQWQEDYAPKPPVQSDVAAESAAISQNESGIPSQTYQPDSSSDSDIPQATTTEQPVTDNQSETITLKNNVLELNIDTHGGDVVLARLLKFNEKLNQNDNKIELLNRTQNRTFVAKSGLIGENAPDTAKGRAQFNVIENSTTDKGSRLVLRWINSDGVEFYKVFELAKDQYDLAVSYRINNKSSEELNVRMFNQLNRDRYVSSEGGSGFGIQAYTGAAYSTEETRYEKYDFDDMDEANLNLKTKAGWVAFLQHYFVTAWIPNQQGINEITSQVLKNKNVSIIRVMQQWVSVGPQATKEISSTLYMGPKEQEQLEQLAEGLDLTVDYGIFWWIGQPLFWLLTFFQSIVVNWGVAIILVTVTVKLLLYPLANAQYRSFAKMRLLQPKLQQLKERYGDDRQKMSMAMMEMYKKEKVNPMGGCLPLIVQMPVFFALYWVLLESYEIRHAPLALWIQDLSAADPYYILPILMGISMWGMQKLQPTAATMDPMQQKIMQFLPVMMTVFFIFFPAGLVLYWLVNNLLSIAQQLYITKKIEREYAAKKA